VLLADRRSLIQVVLNLLSNAIKFTPAGGSVTVSAEVLGGGRFVLAVADSGVGIRADELASVMVPFRQLRGSPTHGAAGAGLGLPLAKSIVELHGGNIDITSRVGAGTTVTVHLPASRIVHPRNRGPAS
jgi:signal transduction histidine kinase